MSSQFPRTEALKFGWMRARENIRFFLPVMLVIAALNYFSSYIDSNLAKEMTLLRLIIGVSGWIIGAVISLGLIKISLKFTDHRDPVLQDFKVTGRKITNFIASSILYGIIVGIGLVLLIVPGIILALKLQFFGYFIEDKDSGPVEALRQSWEVTKGVKWELFVFGLILMGLNLLGTLALLVGLLWTFPATQIASAYIFRRLSGRR